MATQITATLPTLDFPQEVDYPTQEDWAAFSAAAELNFGILGGSWSTQMQLWKTQANAMSIESNTNTTIAQGLANYQGDWISQGYTLGQTVSVSGVYYICKLTHATGQNPTDSESLYWNLALGNWSLKADKTEVALKADKTEVALKVNNYGNETIAGVKNFTSSPIVPTPTTTGNVITMDNIIQKTAVGMGYGTGSGGVVTQLTNKSTHVTLNKPTGYIYMSNSGLAPGAIAMFLFYNSIISYADQILVTRETAGASAGYNIWIGSVGNGVCTIVVKNISDSPLSEAIVLSFGIIKGAFL